MQWRITMVFVATTLRNSTYSPVAFNSTYPRPDASISGVAVVDEGNPLITTLAAPPPSTAPSASYVVNATAAPGPDSSRRDSRLSLQAALRPASPAGAPRA